MNSTVYFAYVAVSLMCAVTGVLQVRRLPAALQVVVALCCMDVLAEVVTYLLVRNDLIKWKNVAYHVYNAAEMTVVGMAFLRLLRPTHYRQWAVANIAVWPLLAVLNIAFLQPLNGLNSNFLLMESFCIDTLSLYTLYRMVKSDAVIQLYRQPGFWLCLIWLVDWSSSFCFWAFVKVLYHQHWQYLDAVINANNMKNLLVCAALAGLFVYSSKTKI